LFCLKYYFFIESPLNMSENNREGYSREVVEEEDEEEVKG